MIINNTGSNAIYSPEIQTYKTTIDPKNINHLVTILSSNLYSQPEASFIRETISNAWDSHVEAGTTDTPVIIVIDNDRIRIRDFGTGLSPKRFEEVYCSIGESTKRESNDYIGAFGIGRFAALACTNTVFITSYYEGTAYSYAMLKSNNNIEICTVHMDTTEEKNGVEISININHVYNYITALKQLTFFPNIFIENNTCYAHKLGTCRDFGTYKATDSKLEHNILLGYVLYPYTAKEANTSRILGILADAGIAVKFDIGEINVTPNRESLISTTKTDKLIADRVNLVYNTLLDKATNKIKKDCTSLIEYTRDGSSTYYYYPLTDTVSKQHDDSPRIILFDDYILTECVSYKGDFYTPVACRKIECLLSTCVHSFIKWECGECKSKSTCTNILNKKIYILDSERIPAYVKAYLKNEVKDFILLKHITKEDIKNRIQEALAADYCNFSTLPAQIIEDAIEEIYNSLNVIHCKDAEVIKYKTVKAANSELAYLTFTSSPYSKGLKRFQPRSIKELCSILIDRKEPIYIGTKEMVTYVSDILTSDCGNYYIYIVKKDLFPKLILLNNPLIISVDRLLQKKEIIISNSIGYAIKEKGDLNSFALYRLKSVVPKNIAQDISDVLKYRARYYPTVPVLQDWVDKTIRCIDLSNKYDKIESITDSVDSNSIDLMAMLLLKTKTVRLNYSQYKRLRSNPIYTILCKK